MLNKFTSFIEEKGLIHESQQILLGVSGGIDSVVMVNLFSQTNFQFALAHCNFKLRGKESDEDQNFVRELANTLGCKFYSINFDTIEYSKKQGVSIQMAARDLRYNWFKELAEKSSFDRVAIAHNRDDVAETMILNLIRGTGLKGLTGIKAVQNKIIRPLLFAGRTEIEEYAIREKIVYREDSSNKQTKYYRNFIRHEILPLMRKINPSVHETLQSEAEIFSSTYDLYKKELKQIRDTITIEESQRWVISIPKVLALRLSPSVLYDLISPYGFSYTDSVNVMKCFKGESGKKFYSTHFTLLKDRHALVIERQDESISAMDFEIHEECQEINFPIGMTFKTIVRTPEFIIPTSYNNIALDAEKVKYPLKLRKWIKGDYFIPLGMNGKKKLSDFFIDKKIDILAKEKIWLLFSEDNIVWVIGHQIDDRYKVRPETKKIVLIYLKN